MNFKKDHLIIDVIIVSLLRASGSSINGTLHTFLDHSIFFFLIFSQKVEFFLIHKLCTSHLPLCDDSIDKTFQRHTKLTPSPNQFFPFEIFIQMLQCTMKIHEWKSYSSTMSSRKCKAKLLLYRKNYDFSIISLKAWCCQCT